MVTSQAAAGTLKLDRRFDQPPLFRATAADLRRKTSSVCCTGAELKSHKSIAPAVRACVFSFLLWHRKPPLFHTSSTKLLVIYKLTYMPVRKISGSRQQTLRLTPKQQQQARTVDCGQPGPVSAQHVEPLTSGVKVEVAVEAMRTDSARRLACSRSFNSRLASVLLVTAILLAGRCLALAEVPDPAGAEVGPYDLDTIPDLQTLLWRHQHWQTAIMLQNSTAKPLAVLVNSNDLVGLGNRIPAIVTGYMIALLTKRTFFLHSTLHTYMDLPFPSIWVQYMHRFSGVTNCNVPWKHLPRSDLLFCETKADKADEYSTAHVLRFSSIDYDVPLLQINPTLEKYFQKFFPDGEVFHAVIRHLLRPTPLVHAAMQPYMQDAQQCVAGMHIRTRKYGGVRVKQFTSIARMITQGQKGTVFVASDASLFSYIQQGLPGRKVWWSSLTSTALEAAEITKGANPGNELSAVMDMFLLSHCKQIILTPASSLGSVAAGYGGVLPVFSNFGKHSDPFLNPWFWKSVTTEPCFFKASTMHLAKDEVSTRFRDKHMLYLYHNQCHYQSHLRQVPPYLKLSTNDTTYIASLVNH